ncbi:MAG: hypothetical protein U0984_16040 [Prosthecobacter sp.]|nr:hypothetical protein [Prosthecobacter sp.]
MQSPLAMISLNPQPCYPLLRTVALAVGALALLTAVTGIMASLTVLAWVVAVISLATFTASFYLKSRW